MQLCTKKFIYMITYAHTHNSTIYTIKYITCKRENLISCLSPYYKKNYCFRLDFHVPCLLTSDSTLFDDSLPFFAYHVSLLLFQRRAPSTAINRSNDDWLVI